MNVIGHNPNGLVSRFLTNHPFKVPVKTIELREEHRIFGALGVNERPHTIREV